VGPAAKLATQAAAPLTVASLALIYGWTWIHLQAPVEAAREVALRGAAGALVAFMVFGRVFSPQYLVWLLPLGALVAQSRGGVSAWFLLSALALTQIIYPATYAALQQLRPWACGLVILRNTVLVGWVWHLTRIPDSAQGPA
jgi:hypothetical protein